MFALGLPCSDQLSLVSSGGYSPSTEHRLLIAIPVEPSSISRPILGHVPSCGSQGDWQGKGRKEILLGSGFDWRTEDRDP